MAKQNIFEKVGNYLTFGGNLNRMSFLMVLMVSEILYNVLWDMAIDYRFNLQISGIYMGTIFCYLYGAAVAGRLRNLKINPCGAYFFVLTLWLMRFIIFSRYDWSTVYRVELVYMLEMFMFLPLFVKDKKMLQFEKV